MDESTSWIDSDDNIPFNSPSTYNGGAEFDASSAETPRSGVRIGKEQVGVSLRLGNTINSKLPPGIVQEDSKQDCELLISSELERR